MHYIYNFSIRVYFFLIKIASLFNNKAKLFVDGRKNLFNNLNKIDSKNKLAWFHCASLGEFEQGRPLIEKLKKEHPEYKILLTFFSPSGFEIRKNYRMADYIFYLPVDTPKNAKKFVDLVKPDIVFFIKYEFWFNFLKEIKKNNIPLYVVSAIFRNKQSFFKWYGKRYRKELAAISHFFVQDDESKRLLAKININNVTVTGDTRFDRVYEISKQSKELPIINNFKNDTQVFIAGSTWKPDEEIITSYINKNHNKIKFIIAPHEIDETNIRRIENSIADNIPVVRYSNANEKDLSSVRVLIVDNIGLLSSIYKYANIAYIGGGFGKGIHNILEAACYSIPVIFGSNYYKFNEAVELVKKRGAFSI
ncbi:MAG: 3-deoxy-D-manno-octulosonic acid transferase, partial [Bacteroidales bacterium]|nr:3-deoxy-D-manno-octulosonic acid transferase [Bacteroidales bacterium]